MALFALRSYPWFGPRHRPEAKRPWRIRTSLILLAAACLLPGALMSTYFIVVDYRQRCDEALQNAVASARSIAAALDRDLASVEAGLRVMATAPSLLASDLPAFYTRAKEALPYQHINNYVLIEPDGRQVLNTLRPWGTPLPTVGGPPSLQGIFDHDTMVLTDLFLGPVTGKHIIGMGVPVHLNGRIIYSLNAGIFPERMTRLLQAQHLPKNWIAAILDSQGQIVTRSHDVERYLGKPAVPDLVNMSAQQREGTMETVSLEGIPVITAFSRSNLSSWTAAVGIPRADLTTDLKRALLIMVTANVLLFASAMWVAWYLALRHVVNPTDRLLNRMDKLARHEDPGPRSLARGSLELQRLEQGFEDLRARLQRHDHERQETIERLSTTLECISDGFYLLDHDSRFAYVNAQAEILLGMSRDSLLERNHWTCLAAIVTPAMRQAYEHAVTHHQPTSLDWPLPERGLNLEINAYPSSSGLAVYFRDITAQRQVRDAQAAQVAAEAANRAKSEFLSRMSHELRTPLNAVLGFAQVLRMDNSEPLTDRQRTMVERIESAGAHLLAMISDVLDLSRVEVGTIALSLQALDIQAVVQDCALMVDAQARSAGVHLDIHIAPQATQVLADKTRLKQVLLNLLSNAIKYNRPQGQVTLHILREADLIVFKVEDTGIGLTPAQQAHLFEPFNRLGREQGSTPGTGIGLVICRKLIELMGGHLLVSSDEARGSVFSFSLSMPPNNGPQHR